MLHLISLTHRRPMAGSARTCPRRIGQTFFSRHHCHELSSLVMFRLHDNYLPILRASFTEDTYEVYYISTESMPGRKNVFLRARVHLQPPSSLPRFYVVYVSTTVGYWLTLPYSAWHHRSRPWVPRLSDDFLVPSHQHLDTPWRGR